MPRLPRATTQVFLRREKARILRPARDGEHYARGTFVSEERFIHFIDTVSEAKVRADLQQLASEQAKRVFAIFQRDDVTDDVIKQWQDKLLNRDL